MAMIYGFYIRKAGRRARFVLLGLVCLIVTVTGGGCQAPDTGPQGEYPSQEAISIVQVAAGHGFGLLLTGRGEVYGWGESSHGELGKVKNVNADSIDFTLDQIENLPDVVLIFASSDHNYALTREGEVYSWGANYLGELGRPQNVGTFALNPVPRRIPQLDSIVTISGGTGHTLAVRTGGVVYGWGINECGQLGRKGTIAESEADATCGNETDPSIHTRPAPVTGLPDSIHGIAAGSGFSLALTEGGEVYSWGVNSYGQLGRKQNAGTKKPNPVPQSMKEFPQDSMALGQPQIMKSFAVGDLFALVLMESGSLYSWGSNGSGQLGRSENLGSSSPNPEPKLVQFKRSFLYFIPQDLTR